MNLRTIAFSALLASGCPSLLAFDDAHLVPFGPPGRSEERETFRVEGRREAAAAVLRSPCRSRIFAQGAVQRDLLLRTLEAVEVERDVERTEFSETGYRLVASARLEHWTLRFAGAGEAAPVTHRFDRCRAVVFDVARAR